MLNELLLIEEGLRVSGIEMAQPHTAIKSARKMPTARVCLDEKGNVFSVKTLQADTVPWTLRDGQHNSFPFVQIKAPLLLIPANSEEIRKIVIEKKKDKHERHKALLELTATAQFNDEAVKDWPGAKMRERLRDRLEQLSYVDSPKESIAWAVFERILRSCTPEIGGNPKILFKTIVNSIVEKLKQSAQDEWFEIAVALFIGKEDKKAKKWLSNGAFLFDAEDFSHSIIDHRLIIPVTKALNNFDSETSNALQKKCGLTGKTGLLHCGNFPQPNLSGLGQTYIFAKNKEIPANGRYRCFAADAMPLGGDVATKLAGALTEITKPERENVTWRKIPGEAPKQMDLLIAFVDGAMNARIAENLADEDGDFDDEDDDKNQVSGSISAFEKRTERLIQTIQGKDIDPNRALVRLSIFRKVDPANRKAIYSNTPTVNDLDQSAKNWALGEKNIPHWLKLPVFKKAKRKTERVLPPHVAPLGLIKFSKQIFIRGGTEHQEIGGIPAAEALRFFLDFSGGGKLPEKLLRHVLRRRTSLLTGAAHMEHTPNCWKRKNEVLKKHKYFFSLYRESLKTVTIIGIALHKLSRKREVYMNEAAFKLGQLLASADIVHAGYCADVRGGETPPSLLGNQVFTMAQNSPSKALSTLCRRWKPYDGWSKKATRDSKRIEALKGSSGKNGEQRYWDIKKALRHAREMRELARELTQQLKNHGRVTDEFRAELLLGYLAGLPKAEQKTVENESLESNNQ